MVNQDMMRLVMHVANERDQSLKAITVRIPEATYDWLRQYATRSKVSLNSVVAEAVVEYTTKVQRASVVKDIRDLQQSLGLTRRDSGETDSAQDLREIRVSHSLEDIPKASPEKTSAGPKSEDIFR